MFGILIFIALAIAAFNYGTGRKTSYENQIKLRLIILRIKTI